MPKAIIDSLEVDAQGLEVANIDESDLERMTTVYDQRYASASKVDSSTNDEGNKIDAQGLEATDIEKHALEMIPIIYSRRTPASTIARVGLDIFFLSNHLTHPGGKLKLHFDRGSKSKFLPFQVAKSFPFSHDKVPEILNLFSVRPNSAQAKLMKETIIGCEESAVGGEDNKYCATSLEDLVDYVVSNIGNQVKVLSTAIDKDVTTEYTIEKAQKVSSDGNFVCHKMRYPYAVFHCHKIRDTDAYVVSLIDANGQKSKAAAVCHRDTSSWNPELFNVLKIKPGSAPICHFVAADDMIWTWNDMPLATQAQSL